MKRKRAKTITSSIEIEKKYLLRSFPPKIRKGGRIRQGYLLTGDPEIRLRKKAKSYFITLKRGKGFERLEHEVSISKAAFDILWTMTRGRRLEKDRFEFQAKDGHVWEIDQYRGKMEGLITAETELSANNERYSIPAVIKKLLVADITKDPRY